MQKKVLIAGADDSNHAGTSKGELIVMTFSQIHEDSIVQDHKNGRDYEKCLRWLEDPSRDYLFTILTEEKYRHKSDNLVTVSPFLIDCFREENNFFPETLKLYLDGILHSDGKKFLRENLTEKHNLSEIVLGNFIKKKKLEANHVSKRPCCPPVVYYADTIAHHLSHQSFIYLTLHTKFRNFKE